jgi:esterase/lipase
MLRLAARFRPGNGDKSPLSIDGDERGVLCLHGITGTPFEIRPLAEALARRGCTVRAPMLAGHGRTLADLAASGWQDWLRSAEEAFDELRAPSRSAASRWAACWRCGWPGCTRIASRRWP